MDKEKYTKRSLRSTSSPLISDGGQDMASPATATDPTTNESSTSPNGNHDFEVYIRSTLEKIQEQLDDVKRSNSETKSEILKSLDFNHAQVKELNEKVVSQDNMITALQQLFSQIQESVNKQASRISALESSNTYLESYMRRSNLIFDGCQEREQEDVYAIIVNILTNVLNLDMNTVSDIDKIHRYGRSFAGKPRPIIVKFTKHSSRDKVLQAAKQLKNHPEKNLHQRGLTYRGEEPTCGTPINRAACPLSGI